VWKKGGVDIRRYTTFGNALLSDQVGIILIYGGVIYLSLYH